MLTPIHLGAKVIGREGEHLGKLKYVAVSPVDYLLTYLVVEKGWPDTEDKVVAARLLKTVSENERTLHLNLSHYEMEKLVDFVEREYVSMGAYTYDEPVVKGKPIPFDGYESVSTGRELQPHSIEPYDEKINLPEDALIFHQGAKVEAQDGKIGVLKGVKLDSESSKVVSLMLEEGFLFGEEFEIPVEIVERTFENDVYLKLTRDELSTAARAI